MIVLVFFLWSFHEKKTDLFPFHLVFTRSRSGHLHLLLECVHLHRHRGRGCNRRDRICLLLLHRLLDHPPCKKKTKTQVPRLTSLQHKLQLHMSFDHLQRYELFVKLRSPASGKLAYNQRKSAAIQDTLLNSIIRNHPKRNYLR